MGYDSIIIGAGIIGVTLARELAKKGQTVLVLDRRAGPSLEASGASVGILSYAPSQNRPQEWHVLAQEAISHHHRLERELKSERSSLPSWHWPGRLNVALNQKAEKKIKKAFDIDKTHHEHVEWLDSTALHECEPHMTPNAIGAELLKDCGWINALALTLAVEESAKEFGAKFRYQASVRELIFNDKQAQGVSLNNGENHFSCNVVIAAGAWSSLLEPQGRLIVEPVKGQALTITRPEPCRVNHIVFGNGVYLAMQDQGLTIGATHEHVGFDTEVTKQGTTKLLAQASALYPGLSNCDAAHIVAWAGLRPGTKDRVPIIGPSVHIQHLWWATGHFTHGILLAPLTAWLLACAIADNKTDARFTTALKNI